MIPQVGGFQGCYLDNHRNNWCCACAVRKRPLEGPNHTASQYAGIGRRRGRRKCFSPFGRGCCPRGLGLKCSVFCGESRNAWNTESTGSRWTLPPPKGPLQTCQSGDHRGDGLRPVPAQQPRHSTNSGCCCAPSRSIVLDFGGGGRGTWDGGWHQPWVCGPFTGAGGGGGEGLCPRCA